MGFQKLHELSCLLQEVLTKSVKDGFWNELVRIKENIWKRKLTSHREIS